MPFIIRGSKVVITSLSFTNGEARSRLLNVIVCVNTAFSQVHAYIITSLKKEMPSMFGKDNKKKELITNLSAIYEKIEKEHNISPGDFPNLKKMQVMRD